MTVFVDDTEWVIVYESRENDEPKDCDDVSCAGTVMTDYSENVCAECGLVHNDKPVEHRPTTLNPRGNVVVRDYGEPDSSGMTTPSHERGPPACADHDGRVRMGGGWHYPYLSAEFGREYCIDACDDVTEGLWTPHARS